MKNRRALDFVLAALLFMTVLTVDMPLIQALEWSPETQLSIHPSKDVSPFIMQALDGTIWVVWVSNRTGTLNDEIFYTTSSNYGLSWSLDKRLTNALGDDSNPSIIQASNGLIWVVWCSDRTGPSVSINVDDRVLVTGWDGWTKTGSSPYLNAADYPRKYINSSVASDRIGNFTFQDVPIGFTPGKVTLRLKTWQTGGDGSDYLKIYLYNGTKWQTYTVTPTSTSAPGDYKEIDVSNFLKSEAAINAAKMALEHVVVGSADTIGVDHAYILVNPLRNYKLYYKISSNNGAWWSDDTKLTIDPNCNIDPSIIQASNGLIWVVWCSNRTGNSDLFYKIYDGSAWSTEMQLTNDPNPDKYPSIMQAKDGTIWVVWSSSRIGNSDLFYKTFDGTAWSSVDTQLTNNTASDLVPSIAQDRLGTIWVVWYSDRRMEYYYDLYYKVYSDSTWSVDRQLTSYPTSDVRFGDMTPSIVQINDRKIWIVWTADRSGNFDIYYKTVQVNILGDVNLDGKVNIQDVPFFIADIDATPTSPNWHNGRSDFNDDKVVDVLDVTTLSTNYGKTL